MKEEKSKRKTTHLHMCKFAAFNQKWAQATTNMYAGTDNSQRHKHDR